MLLDHNLNKQDQSVSLISQFFEGKSIFLTGASGFVGRFLVYKLLKDCSGIQNIYICLRGKKGKSVEQRFEEFKNLELFSFLPDKSRLDKIVPLTGDVCKPGLGLSDEDTERVIRDVDIVFHSAATIRFTEPLKSASLLHVTGTQHVIDLCSRMHHLLVLVHVSSVAAWSLNCTQIEDIPPCQLDPHAFGERLMKASEEEATQLERELIGPQKEGKWLNTYALTKSLAELVVAKSSIKSVIIRPPFLASPIREPEIGWFDTPQSGAGLTALFSFGIIRIGNVTHDMHAEFMPIDMCINAMIRATWHHAVHSSNQLEVYNMSSINTQPVKVKQLIAEAIDLGCRYPSVKMIRPPIEMYQFQPSKQLVQLKSFFTHTLFCLMVDLILFVMGQKPMLYEQTMKCKKALDAVFTSACEYKTDITIKTGKLETIDKYLTSRDNKVFFYDTTNMPLRELCEQNHLRFRRHVLKEPDENIEFARKRLRLVGIFYRLFKILFWISLVFAIKTMHDMIFGIWILWLPFATLVSYCALVFLVE